MFITVLSKAIPILSQINPVHNIPPYSIKTHFGFSCDIPVVFYKLNTKYITISQNTTKIIVLYLYIEYITLKA